MSLLKRYLIFCVFACLFILSTIPFIYTHTENYEKQIYKNTELYNVSLGRISNLNEAVLYVDSIYYAENKSLSFFDTLKYIKKTTRFVKERFHHGLANYSAQENWITDLSAKLFWPHFSAIVIPDDVLKHPKGICSQQAIVYMKLLNKKGIRCRKVSLGDNTGGHFLTEVYYDSSWHLYDVNKEPEWKKITHHHESMEYYKQNPDTLFKAYENRITRTTFDKFLQKVKYGKPNTFPAPHMILFHYITKWLTYIFPCVFFIATISFLFKIRKEKTNRIERTYVVSSVTTNA